MRSLRVRHPSPSDQRGSRDEPGRALAPDDLLRACLRGEDAAWRIFLERYGDLIYSVPLKMGVRRSDAEEIFQNALLAIYRRLGTLRDPGRIVNWVSEIARRQTLYYLRKRTHEAAEPAEGLPEMVDEAPLPQEALESLEASQVIREGLLDLSPRCRDLLTALYLADAAPSYKEIAERYGIAIGTVGPTRAHCLKALRAALVERGYREETAPRRQKHGPTDKGAPRDSR